MQISTNQNINLTTELRELFHYSIFPIIFLFLVLIILIIVLLFLTRKEEKESIPIVITPNYKDRNQIKKLYLNQLNELLNSINNHSLTNRKAYQELSKIIRKFIYEMTSIQVQNYTLTDIEKINMPILSELVREYYDPEFSKISGGNIIHSIEKTRKVIESWN